MDNKQSREQFIHLEKKLEESNLRKCIIKELTLREGGGGEDIPAKSCHDGTARHV